MSLKNLYSLLSNLWMLSEQSVQASLPLLQNIIEKGEYLTEAKTELEPLYYSQIQDVITTQRIPEDAPEQSIVAELPIQGMIMKHSDWCSYGTQEYMAILEEWRTNDVVLGVLLNLDSGGGSVSGTPEFADYIKNYTKPIVAFTNGVLCSAAYYLAAGANKIYASPYIDAIGSIGTMYYRIDWTGKYEKEGAKILEVYASRSTQKNGAIRTALDKENPSIVKIVEEMLDPLNNRFLDFIKENRSTISSEALTGKEYFSASVCLEQGLVDVIGTKEDAVQEVIALYQARNTININANNTMSEKTYLKLATVLGLDEVTAKGGFLFGTKTASFTEDQLDKLEANLQTDSSGELLALTTSKIKAEQELQLEKTKNSTFTSTLTQAMADCKLVSTGTFEGDIKLLSAKVVEYGAEDAATVTQLYSEGDRVSAEKETTSIYDSFKK